MSPLPLPLFASCETVKEEMDARYIIQSSFRVSTVAMLSDSQRLVNLQKKKSANVKNWCKGKRAALKKSEVSSSHRKVFMDARSICIKIEKLHKVADQQTRTL